MANPRPAPPYLRVAEPSAWRKGSKRKGSLAAGMQAQVLFQLHQPLLGFRQFGAGLFLGVDLVLQLGGPLGHALLQQPIGLDERLLSPLPGDGRAEHSGCGTQCVQFRFAPRWRSLRLKLRPTLLRELVTDVSHNCG